MILKEDNPIRGTWRLEIVDSVEVSSDGLTRSVRLRMSTDRLTDKGGGQSRVPRSTNSQVGGDRRGGYHIKTLIVNFATISRNLGGSVTNHESLNCADSRSN